jgi:transposase
MIMDGPHRQAMGHRENHPSTRSRKGGRTRPSVDGSANQSQRDTLDLADRSAVGGPSGTIWELPDGSSTVSTVEEGGVFRGSPRGPCRGPSRTGRAQPGGMLHRRDFRFGEKRGRQVGKTKRGKGTKIMAIVDGNGLPIAGRTESASPAEVTLVEDTLDCQWIPDYPKRLIGDKAYDSDPLDEELAEQYGTEMIAPNRRNRVRRTQDGRPLRRYKRRWKVERLFAWLHNFRRLVVRWEYHAENFTAFFYLGCAVILLRHL